MNPDKLKNINLSEKSRTRIAAAIQLIMLMAAVKSALKKEVKSYKKILKKKNKSKK